VASTYNPAESRLSRPLEASIAFSSMSTFSAISDTRAQPLRGVALCARELRLSGFLQIARTVVGLYLLANCTLAISQTRVESTPQATADSKSSSVPAKSSTESAQSARSVVVLLLPSEQPLLRRASQTVRDGVRAVASKAGATIELRDCAYGAEGAHAAYRRCVTPELDVVAVIGPLGRSEVTQLLAQPLDYTRPTLMLSPSGVVPPESFFVLAPDLESEAERVAKQALEDACTKPMIVDAGGPLAARISVAFSAHFRGSGAATTLRQSELPPRARWVSVTDQWRRDGIDCVLFAGNGAQLTEFRPFLRNIVVYATSASYEAELESTVDWTGVRIADAPFVLEPGRSDHAVFATAEPLTPTLARLYALGIDAARIVIDAILIDRTRTVDGVRPVGPERDPARSTISLASSFEGAIGRLSLQNRQYVRTPAVGEFRGRTPQPLGF
jgi:outer membrane PBP1 activator LpoA protein